MSFLQNVSFRVFKSKSQNVNNVKYAQISALVGREITAENLATLTQEDMAKIEAGQSTPPTNVPTDSQDGAVQETELSAQIRSAVEAAVNPISEKLNAVQQSLSGFEGRLATVEAKPSSSPSPTPLVHGNVDEAPKHAWEDPKNDPIAQQAMKDLGHTA